MRKKVFLAMAFAAMLGSAATAQTSLTFKVGGAFPMGDFSDAKASYTNGIQRWGLATKHAEGGAGSGFSAGFDILFGVPSIKGFGINLSLDFLYNGLNEDLNDYFEDMVDKTKTIPVTLNNGSTANINVNNFSIKKPTYINVPVLLGAVYSFNAAPSIGLFASGSVGANIRFVTPVTQEIEGTINYSGSNVSVDGNFTTSFKTATSFAFRLTAGITFMDKYVIEVGYYNLGAGKVRYEQVSTVMIGNTETSDKDKETLKSITPELLTLRLGYKF